MSSRRRRSPSSSSEDSNDATESENNKVTNVFRNDGSFLEMFKKMQKASQSTDNTSTSISIAQTPSSNVSKDAAEKEIQLKEDNTKPKPVPMVGRRRCIKPLPVGKVKKLKADDEEEKKPPVTDAWAKYLEEVKKYKETYCDSEAKNRSLVK